MAYLPPGKEKNMKLYEKKPILFSLCWIAAYCLVMTVIKARFGYESVWMLLALLVFAAAITICVKAGRMEKNCGLAGWPKETKRYLYFIPMWILATGNLWDGFALSYRGMAQAVAVLSMLAVGYVEEMLFRGFLFRALLSREKTAAAIVISALTFGMGHIVNLFAGQAGINTLIQIIFAISWGFILTMVFYSCGSLLPCIVAHAMIDAFSTFGKDGVLADQIYVGATVVTAIVYCIYLARLGRAASIEKQFP